LNTIDLNIFSVSLINEYAIRTPMTTNASASLPPGNIMGSVIAAVYVKTAWGLSFIVPGCLAVVVGVFVYVSLKPHPKAARPPAPGGEGTVGRDAGKWGSS
jgi:hypothetical protein